MDGLKIVVCQQMERAEDLIILDIKGPGGLKVPSKGGYIGRLNDLFRTSHRTELLVVVGCR